MIAAGSRRQTWTAGHLYLQVDFFLSIVNCDVFSMHYVPSHVENVFVPGSNQGLTELL